MNKFPIALFALLPAILWLSCGGGSSSAATTTSGIKYRAFITNSVSAGTETAGIFILDAINDVRAHAGEISAGNNPGMMVVTPNLADTLVFSGNGTQSSDNQFTVIANSSEMAIGHVTLPGMTYSFVASPDSSTAYVAIPTAPVLGYPPGVVDVISTGNAAITGEVNVPAVQYLSIGNTGNRLLAFSQGSAADTVTVITPSQIGLGTGTPTTTVCCFDHPVQAFFTTDDSTAYVVNCGPECGGNQASIQTLDLTTNTAGPPSVVCTGSGNPQCIGTLPLPAASVALINGTTMYVAGTPPYSNGVPTQPCTGQTTAATSCGLLSQVDLNSMTVSGLPLTITDGYHDQIALGANGQLYIGAHTCTEIIPPPPPSTGETRGCLTIYNTLTAAVGSAPAGGILIPPETGDVTSIQPISTRQVVYVVQGQNVQGGTLYIYDDTIDALEYNPNNPKNPGLIGSLIGNFTDVKTVDF